jgi:hypothetical protein
MQDKYPIVSITEEDFKQKLNIPSEAVLLTVNIDFINETIIIQYSRL